MRPARRTVWPLLTGIALLAVAIAAAVVLLTGGEDGAETAADAQTVRFQRPTDDGPDPFTRPADVRGDGRVQVGSGPFGGTGSDLVCDRELLIRSLRAQPDRLREWARVLRLPPTPDAVARYVRRLRPVTLTRDTRVTNHSFVDGKAVPFQSILQAGTAVLVDRDGRPVARCRCGNPLLEPVFIDTAKCFGCPPNYRPPPPCDYLDYDDADYARFGDADYARSFDPADYRGKCYLPYPDPPGVRRPGPLRRAPPPTEAATDPSAYFSPASGQRGDTFTLLVTGFRPGVTLGVSLTRPDGVVESYSIATAADGSGRLGFAQTGGTEPVGTYTAVITDAGSGDTATASAELLPDTPAPTPDTGLNCDAPRSQLEFEQCQELQGRAPQPEPPPSNYECPEQPPASPGEDYLRNCPPE